MSFVSNPLGQSPMKTSSSTPVASKAKRATKSAHESRGAAAKRARAKKAATNHAIATDLAPAVAIALLEKTEQAPSAPSPALDCLAAAAAPSEAAGKLRVQLMFETGAVLPVEMSVEAGATLSQELAKQLPKTTLKK